VRKIGNRKKKCISVLVLAVAVFAMAFTSAYGASGIELKHAASVTLGVGTESFTELADSMTKITVSLYKVADVKVSGAYTVTGAFADNAKLKSEIESVSSTTSSTDWSTYAAEAKTVVDGMTSADKENATKVTITGGSTKKQEIGVGLYLALVDPVDTETYEYTALPFLIAVPGNNYYSDPDAGDDWIYDVEANIKFEYADLLGNLTIDKTLNTYNASLGTATFVYEVEATKNYRAVGGEQEEVVYNNVVAIDFTDAGSKGTIITGIPAGAEVTVKEVYSGASYSVERSDSATATIKADDEVEVSFTNDYNDSLLYQDTVVNSFSNNEEGDWDWKAIKNGVEVKSSKSDSSQTTDPTVSE
jgi:hypothetical protein